jgi:hypothetical protein
MREPPFAGQGIIDDPRLILDAQPGCAQGLGEFLRRHELAPSSRIGSIYGYHAEPTAIHIRRRQLFRVRLSVAATSIIIYRDSSDKESGAKFTTLGRTGRGLWVALRPMGGDLTALPSSNSGISTVN